MTIIEIQASRITVNFEIDELYILNNALNEVCNGLYLDAFSTRMGSEREQVAALLAEIHATLERFESSPT